MEIKGFGTHLPKRRVQRVNPRQIRHFRRVGLPKFRETMDSEARHVHRVSFERASRRSGPANPATPTR